MLQQARENYYWFTATEAGWGRAVSAKVELCSAPHGASSAAQFGTAEECPTQCSWSPNGAPEWLHDQKPHLGQVCGETGGPQEQMNIIALINIIAMTACDHVPIVLGFQGS